MHPVLVRAFVEDCVADVDERLRRRPDLGVIDTTLQPDPLELRMAFDHDEHETELVNAASGLVLPGGQQLVRAQRIPIIGRSRHRRLVLAMEIECYDLVAPTAQLLDADGVPLPAEQWPTAFSGGGIVERHPVYQRPFFCRRGLREYHEHPQHEDDPWARWRDALPLHVTVIELLDDLRRRWHGAA